MILLADVLPISMFLAGCALLTLILLRRWSRYYGRRSRRKKSEPPIAAQPRPHDAWGGMQRDAAAHIERQKVELHEFSRDVAGTLDSKMLLLGELITKSDEQIARLEQLLAELEGARS